MRLKRQEDKALLKEYEKAKIQIQQLQEHKRLATGYELVAFMANCIIVRQMAEAHSELNKQLIQAKKEAKEAIEEKLRHAEDMKDLEETAEMATLDKEMAEEKYEQVVRELEQTKERLEEVTGITLIQLVTAMVVCPGNRGLRIVEVRD